ncbi:MAG: carbamoyltransferase family protein [Solirubrobacteraceae bacterium]
MHILGLTTMGNAAATLIRDGEVIAAVEEERFSRIKQHDGFPFEAVRYCLAEGGIEIADVEHIGLYWKPWVLRHKAIQALRSGLISSDMFRARIDRGVDQVGASYVGMLRYPRLIREHFGPSQFRFHFLDHHLCHAASAFYVSPFEAASILTYDGTGEATTTMLAVADARGIRPLKRIKLPHSLGQFYSAVTNFLGFDMIAGDEWKVMGLAAYGNPTYAQFFAERVLRSSGDGDFSVNVRVLDHHLAKSYQFSEEVVRALGPPRGKSQEVEQRHQDIAASAQLVLENVALGLARDLHRRTGSTRLCLAGGTALNSVMNGRIIRESPFEEVFIQPVAGDAGCSLGAAFMVHHALGGGRGYEMKHPYLGPAFTSAQCGRALTDSGLEFQTLEDSEMLPLVARLIADGAIVGWFQGRAEFGPRALGNRSFLADPRRADMRELLNQKVKLREWFRPLAPSLLEESAEQLFGRDYRDPFMVTVLSVTESERARIPAVVHVDGSARPQTVSRATNPRYWQLISEFEAITGVPLLLNTSFNVQEPIVCTPADAIATFRKASFDVLVLENNIVRRSDAATPAAG